MPALSSFRIDLPWAYPETPEYRVFELGKWKLSKTPAMSNIIGYWTPLAGVPDGHMLQRKTHGEWKIWMSLTPMELQSHQRHIASAHGNVVVAGLGMGMVIFNMVKRPEVTRVLVMEKDPQVIELFERITDWRNWPGAEKLEIRQGDALLLKDKGNTVIDFLYVDIWEKLGTEVAHIQVQTMVQNLRPKSVGYWGQELDFALFLVQNEFPFERADLAIWHSFRQMVGLPLVGGDFPRYPRLACAAVALQAVPRENKKDPVVGNRLYITALRLAGAFDKKEPLCDPAKPIPETKPNDPTSHNTEPSEEARSIAGGGNRA
jgi:hypothetical protein